MSYSFFFAQFLLHWVFQSFLFLLFRRMFFFCLFFLSQLRCQFSSFFIPSIQFQSMCCSVLSLSLYFISFLCDTFSSSIVSLFHLFLSISKFLHNGHKYRENVQLKRKLQAKGIYATHKHIRAQYMFDGFTSIFIQFEYKSLM